MCAICGIINFDGSPVDAASVTVMRDVMVNRGPEYGGLHMERNVGLGHRRLKIIDLSPNANQPMSNEDGSVWVVFNGEIYNFQELREQLLARQHRFQSRSDTEVIVHGYEEWGEKIFEKLDGMFAIGIWDERKQTLLLGRDRWGKKPLFYFAQGREVLFASDIKAIWELKSAALTLNHAAIDCYLHHLSPTQDHCIFNEVAKVKPAHYEVFTREGRRAVHYWQPSFTDKVRLSEAEALEQLDAHLRTAIKKRLVSDVPLGAFLSGGVDSSVVVALMSQINSSKCKTFSVGFAEQDFSELQFSRAVAERYQTEHQEITVQPDMLAVLPSLVWEYGEPFGDSSAIPTYYVAKAARQFVTVALTGDGGDEMFGGYDIARASWYGHHYMRLCPASVRKKLEQLAFGGGAGGNALLQKLKTLVVHSSDAPAIRHSYTMGFNATQKQSLYTADFAMKLNGHSPEHIFREFYPTMRGWNVIDQNLYLTLMGRLPNDYLIKVDVASMKSALELRSPFLDSELAAFSQSLDPLLKVKGGAQKYLLKKLAERYLPRETIYRKKRGFSLPLTHWLRGDLAPLVARLLLEGETIKLGWFNRVAVETLLREHSAGAKDHTHRIYLLLWLELWWRLFMTRSLKATDGLH